jgi:poly(hydroxyalkanoate) depolymerase family esterase
MRRRIVLMTLPACGAVLAIAISVSSTGAGSAPSADRHRHEILSLGGHVYHYAVYVPSSHRPSSALPLVVVIHGCTTTADQQAAASGYNSIAEQRRFVVLYPDVDSVDVAHGRCWKGIWDPGAEGRSRGDAGAIAAMTSVVVTRWHIDRARVFVIGISAGAFETAILGAAYSDLYAAIGIHSGAAYRGGEPGCLAENEVPTGATDLASAALAAMGARARVMPVIVFHGDHDDTIPYRCGQEATAQWLRADNVILQRERRAPLPLTPTGISRASVPSGHPYTVLSYADSSGCPIAQLWTVHGMGHYWSGGSADPASVRYSDPRGPSAAAASWAFFSHWRLSGPVGPCARLGHRAKRPT